MRAGVLSNNRIIEYLNKNFINTWVPNCELGRVPSLRDPIAKRRKRESKTFDTTHALAQAIMKGWKKYSPVDALVISPQFEVIGRQPVNELHSSVGDTARRYLTFLQESLAGKFPGFGEDTSEPEPLNSDTALSSLSVVLNNVRTSQEVLNIFRTPEPGHQDYTVIEIDATAFEKTVVCSRLIFLSGMLKPLVRLIYLLVTVNYQQRECLTARLLQRGVFHQVKQTESYTPLIEVNLFGSEPLVIGLAKKGALMLFSLQFLWKG